MMAGVREFHPPSKGAVMRRWFVALWLIALTARAVAGEFEMPVLRGSTPFVPAAPTYTRWSGFYVGGQVGGNSTHMDFAGATESLIAYLLRTTALENEQHPSQWGVLGSADVTGTSYGGFIGYNSQWDDLIIGIDLHYNHGGFFANAPTNPIARAVSAGGNNYLVNITGNASMRITDFGAARLRAGWIFHNFLPYATFGFALGRADVTRSVTVSGAENPPAGYPTVPCDPLAGCTEFSFSTSDAKTGRFIYGWAAGGGMDILVMPNVFVRAEYEYLNFAQLSGIKAQINSARIGAGLRF